MCRKYFSTFFLVLSLSCFSILWPVLGPSLCFAQSQETPVEESRFKAELIQLTQRLVALIQDPEFQKNAKSLTQNKNLNGFFLSIFGTFIGFLILKKVILSSTDRWWMRMFLRLVMIPVFFGTLFLVAYGFFGQPIVEILWAIKKLWLP